MREGLDYIDLAHDGDMWNAVTNLRVFMLLFMRCSEILD